MINNTFIIDSDHIIVRFVIGEEESINQKDLSTIMTIVEINKSAIMEKENTIIFE